MLDIVDFGINYNNKNIFKNLNVQVNKGEILVVTGNSGCGKSSMLKAINGILINNEEVKFSGDIKFCKKSILESNITQRSRFVSTVFQNPKTQFFCINTTDELAFALENRNIEKEKILEIIDEYSEKLGTKELLNKNIFSLSGGEKQLVAITAASCMDNEIYLFDEPSAALDRKSIEHLKNILIWLKAMGKIVIVAEHRLYYLKELMSKLVILDKDNIFVSDKNQDLNSIIERYNLRTVKDISKDDLKKFDFYQIDILNGSGKSNFSDEKINLKCEDFSVCYDNNKVIDFSIGFESGINFIIGSNGVGKTTFIKKMASLIKGKGISFYNDEKIKKTYNYISMVMQDVNYQIFTESVWQEISIVSDDDDKKERALEEVGLLDKRELHPQILSGGEKQRLMIALAKVSDKPIVILDEPTSGLCKQGMTRIINFIHEMEKNGKLVLIITHDYEFINECGGKIYEFIK